MRSVTRVERRGWYSIAAALVLLSTQYYSTSHRFFIILATAHNIRISILIYVYINKSLFVETHYTYTGQICTLKLIELQHQANNCEA